MDINGVSQSISSNNELVTQAVTEQTEVTNKLTNQSVAAKTGGAERTQLQEEGKGVFFDVLA